MLSLDQSRDLHLSVQSQLKKLTYRDNPAAYAADILGVQWWAKQAEIAQALVDHQKVLVKASHSIGKTHACAGIALWYYATRNPSIVLSTAPTQTQVVDLLWREIRSQAPAGTPLQPKAPRIEDTSTSHHYAAGYTARDANAFQGRHEEDLLIIFDEATGVGSEFWTAADAMVVGPNTRWLAVLNPTDTTSQAYAAEQSGAWHVITVSALDHPNIQAELRCQPAPFPKAVRLSWVNERVSEWCTRVNNPTVLDLEWPPGSGEHWRPGPLFESRVMGRWPSQSVTSVWSDALLSLAFREPPHEPLPEPTDVPCEIGCDVARFGDDMTVMHVRRGPVSLHHETHNGWSTAQTAGRLKQLADEYGRRCGVDGKRITVKVDDDGVGGGVVDGAVENDVSGRGYNFIGCSGARKAYAEADYPNRRSETWFTTAQLALENRLDLSRLSADTRRAIRLQLMSPVWKVDSQGRRVVEPKSDTKKRLKRSPDDADALNLAYGLAPELPYSWMRNDPAFRAEVLTGRAQETDEERIARRMAAHLAQP